MPLSSSVKPPSPSWALRREGKERKDVKLEEAAIRADISGFVLDKGGYMKSLYLEGTVLTAVEEWTSLAKTEMASLGED